MRLAITVLCFVLFFSSNCFSKTVFVRCEPDENGMGGACGSGFFISKNEILTANHVINDAERFRIEFDNKYYDGKIVKRDADKDLALITVDFESDDFYEVAEYPASINEEVKCKGFPKATWTRASSVGIVKEFKNCKFPGNKKFVRMCCVWMDVRTGMSGGPLLDDENKVVGVLSTKNADGTYRGNFVCLSEIKSFLRGE